MANRLLDRLGFALWLVGFVLLTLGFLVRLALAGLRPGTRSEQPTARAGLAADRTPGWSQVAEG